MFSRGELVSIKQKALRRRIWFRVLDRTERALVDLTIRVVDAVRSSRLVKVLSNPIEKLREAMKTIPERAREVGRPLVERFSRIAQSFGNSEAEGWAEDEFFAEYIGLCAINKSFNGCF
jgi:hypothetical protein